MHAVRAAIERRGGAIALLTAYAVVVGALSAAVNLSAALAGTGPAEARALLGVTGLVGGLLLWHRPRAGHLVLLTWAVLQIPCLAWDRGGCPTSQVVALDFAFTSQTTVNGVVTGTQTVGVNLVGLMLTLWLGRRNWLAEVQRPNTPARPTDWIL